MNRDPKHSQDSEYDSNISAIYKQASVELPSPELDKNILWQAKIATEENTVSNRTNEQSRKTEKAKKRIWLQWQWGGSVVASILLVSVVLWVNNPAQLDLADVSGTPLLVADGSELNQTSEAALNDEHLAVQATEAMEIARVDVAPEKRRGQSLMGDVADTASAQTDSIERAYTSQGQPETKEPILAAMGKSGRLESLDLMLEEEMAVTQTAATQQVESASISRLQLASDERKKTVVALNRVEEHGDVEKVLVTGSRVKSPSTKDVKSEDEKHYEAEVAASKTISEKKSETPDLYLDEVTLDTEVEGLVQQAKRFQRVLYNTEIQNPEDEKRLIGQLTQVQLQLSDVLLARKQQEPVWELLPRYLDALTPEQQQALKAKLDSIE